MESKQILPESQRISEQDTWHGSDVDLQIIQYHKALIAAENSAEHFEKLSLDIQTDYENQESELNMAYEENRKLKEKLKKYEEI